MPVDVEKLMQERRIVRAMLRFVSPDFQLIRIEWKEGDPVPVIPDDGFLTGLFWYQQEPLGGYAGGDGWLVFGMTPVGLLCQTTGGDKPDLARYPNCQFSRCKVAPSALNELAAEEMQQWR